jgi:thioredoxin reductase
MATTIDKLPVIVIGAGPIGLAAASQLIARGLPVIVLEAGSSVAASVREWRHVRLFSPWQYNIDDAAAKLLGSHGWTTPDSETYPTGGELVENYLEPLSRVPAIAGSLRLDSRVINISRAGIDKVKSNGRASAPFVVTAVDSTGSEVHHLGRAVIDASGTWTQPNPLGVNGTFASGEANTGQISYGIPDVLGKDEAEFAGKRVLVVGAGHSAANVIADLVKLRELHPGTAITWGTRSGTLTRVYGGGDADRLPERGALGMLLQALVKSGAVELDTSMAVVRVETNGTALELTTESGNHFSFDRIVVATGQRPNLSFLREVRLDIDPALECARALGPLIDPNLHSCGTVRPHGHRELSHPEPNFYTVGIKSYGRAPNFLMVTGYEQCRSVVAAIAGDVAAADEVNLVLPETGVCSRPIVIGEKSTRCGGGPALLDASACCARDEAAKSEGKSGCGCKSAA